ncbi:RsmD family RNA methyltransferase [Castellaniella sp. GW247-6E4]|uniref:RsmD family RNA methyltransferase n=1 Tax=Castellaniella sp. GW247-6E4 TaxID=3140380 RepID=UPI0033159C81
MKKHQVRIVGGEYRRTPIPVIEAEHLRPTPDRVRETLFNWLSHFWDGAFADKRVLDLFAGTGALGFEAASRGVAHARLVECSPAALAALRKLQIRLGATARVSIHAGDALAFLRAQSGPEYDLLLLDPPFHQGWIERLWPLLGRALRPGGLAYIETEGTLRDFPPAFSLLREARAGQVHVLLLQFAALQKTMNNPETWPSPTPGGPPPNDNDTETA